MSNIGFVSQGPKRQAMSEITLHDPLDSQPLGAGLNSSLGVKAWRSWAQSKHSDTDYRKRRISLDWNFKCTRLLIALL